MMQKRVDSAGRPSGCTLEQLESRRFLSITLGADGVLHVEGTRRNDAVSITSTTTHGHAGLRVTLNRQSVVYRAKGIRELDIITGKGDDVVSAGISRRSNIPNYYADIPTVPMHVLAGAGDDVITGSNADDNLNGQSGNDSVIGYGGNDSILGGDGNDTILGWAGADTIRGGKGNDDVAGDEDYINAFPQLVSPGTPVTNRWQNDEVDQINGDEGRDTFHDLDDPKQRRDAKDHDVLVNDPIAY
jgi:Ca2+-binding RTX toxin-like protein